MLNLYILYRQEDIVGQESRSRCGEIIGNGRGCARFAEAETSNGHDDPIKNATISVAIDK